MYNSRREANAGEVELLLEEFKNPLCINRYFDYTPDMTGTKHNPNSMRKAADKGYIYKKTYRITEASL